MNKSVTFLIKFSFVVTALIVITMVIDLESLWKILVTISLPAFFFVCVIMTLDQIFMGVKWHYLLRVFHVEVPIRVPVLAYLRSRIFQFLAPSSLGIDAYKTYCVKQHHNEVPPIVSSIIVERAFGAMSSLAILLIMLPFCVDILDFQYKEYVVWISILGFMALCIVIHLMQSYADIFIKVKFPKSFPIKAHDFLENLVINLAKVRQDKQKIWIYFLVSIIEKISYGLVIYLCSRAIGLDQPGLLFIISVAPVFALLERLPISISAIGIREGLFVVLFTPYYGDPTIPIAVSLVLRSAEIVQIIVFFGTWFISRNWTAFDSKKQSMPMKKIPADNLYAVNRNNLDCTDLTMP